MLNIENLTDLRVNSATLEQIRDHLTDREVELIICSSDKIRDYNLEFRGKDSPTDVLSFPIDIEVERLPLGSIIISSDMVLEGAKRFKHSTDDEMALLFIHGILHLLGYDHEADSGEMRDMERELIEKFNLPDSLIVRVESN